MYTPLPMSISISLLGLLAVVRGGTCPIKSTSASASPTSGSISSASASVSSSTATTGSSAIASASASAIASSGSGTLTCTAWTISGSTFSSSTSGSASGNMYGTVESDQAGGRITSTSTTLLGLGGLGGDTIIPCENGSETCLAQMFGFESCVNSTGYAFDDIKPYEGAEYGHVTYTDSSTNTKKCLGTSSTDTSGSAVNGTGLKLVDCLYDWDTVASSGQYWYMSNQNNANQATLISSDTLYFGPSPDLSSTSSSLSLYATSVTGTTETWFTFNVTSSS